MQFRSPIRILYVTPFAQQVSGPDESLLGLLKRLRGIIEPVVVLPPGSPQVSRYEEAGATVVEQSMQRIRRTTNPGSLATYAGLFTPETIRFARLIRSHKIELVHTNMEVVLQSGLAARLAGVPSVYHVRGTSFATPKRVCDVVVGAINRLADEIIVISRAVGDIFYERGIRDKVSMIYNSLDPSRFDHLDKASVAKLRQELVGGERNIDAPLVATVGRINPRKGLECFVESAAIVAREHPRARFAIVGDAAHDVELKYAARLRQLAASLGIGDRLVIAPAKHNIAELMSALDVFVMTTINEGFGRVAIEAMAARRPVVASRVGGLIEIVQDGVTGNLVEVNDHAAFAKAVNALIRSPRQAVEMGMGGRKRVETVFSDDAQVPHVTKIYERALARKNKGHETSVCALR